MDLLTVVAHELGHILGLSDLDAGLYPDQLMTESLPAGVRRLPLQVGSLSLPRLSPSSILPGWAIDRLLAPLSDNLLAQFEDDLVLEQRLAGDRPSLAGGLLTAAQDDSLVAPAWNEDLLVEDRRTGRGDDVFESLQLDELLGDETAAEEPDDLLSLLAKSRT